MRNLLLAGVCAAASWELLRFADDIKRVAK